MRTSSPLLRSVILLVIPLTGCPINKNDGTNPVACECETVVVETGETGSDTADSADTADSSDTGGGTETGDTAAAGPRAPSVRCKPRR